MINAKELRIGNLVMSNETIPGHIHEISCADMGSFFSSIKESLHPIPLNVEWLERMGFEQFEVVNSDGDENTGWCHTVDHRFTWWSDRLSYGFEELHQIKAVHQLQNLYFALTGDELKISL